MGQREVQLKMSEIIEAKPSLDVLLNSKLSPRVSFRLSLLIEEVNPPLKVYAEQQAVLAKEHGKLSDDGQQYTLEGEGLEKFNEGIAVLNDEPVTMKVPELTAEDLGEGAVLSPVEFFKLRWLFQNGG